MRKCFFQFCLFEVSREPLSLRAPEPHPSCMLQPQCTQCAPLVVELWWVVVVAVCLGMYRYRMIFQFCSLPPLTTGPVSHSLRFLPGNQALDDRTHGMHIDHQTDDAHWAVVPQISFPPCGTLFV